MRRTLLLATALPFVLAACATTDSATGARVVAPGPAALTEAQQRGSIADQVVAEQLALTARAAPAYPQTAREAVVEEQFGVAVADPYRWLENDVRNDPRVRDWVTAQNQVTNAFLEKLPHRAAFKERMRQVYNFERYSVPDKAGNRYFYTRNDGLQNQSVPVCARGAERPPRMLIDPNKWSQDQATALAEWEVSPTGAMSLRVQEGGSDWRTIRVLDVDDGAAALDEVQWAKFTNIDWAKDGSGFYYSRFRSRAAPSNSRRTNENQAVYFHRVTGPAGISPATRGCSRGPTSRGSATRRKCRTTGAG
jgi:prolyl oligopeptidase